MSEVLLGREPVREAVRPPLIELAGVEKVYRTGKLEYPALRGIDLSIADGDMVAIVGPSGSGKSTIMNMITGIDRPTAGTVTVRGERVDQMSEEELAIWRGKHVGVVFQFFQLLPTLTALENAMLPLDFARRGSKRERRERAHQNLELVGIPELADHLPSEMSGGQQQRVAIARALAPLSLGPAAGEIHRQHGVLQRGQRRQQLEELKHDADALASPDGEFLLAHQIDPATVDRDRPRGRPIDSGDHVHDRRLATPGGPDDRDHVAGLDGQIDPAQCAVGDLAGAIDLLDAGELDQRRAKRLRERLDPGQDLRHWGCSPHLHCPGVPACSAATAVTSGESPRGGIGALRVTMHDPHRAPDST